MRLSKASSPSTNQSNTDFYPDVTEMGLTRVLFRSVMQLALSPLYSHWSDWLWVYPMPAWAF